MEFVISSPSLASSAWSMLMLAARGRLSTLLAMVYGMISVKVVTASAAMPLRGRKLRKPKFRAAVHYE